MVKKQPERMCVACRAMKEKRRLIRIVRDSEGRLQVDASGKQPGRGAYICADEDCLKKAKKNRSLEKSLKMKIDEALWPEVEARFAAIAAAAQAQHKTEEA